MSKDLLFANWDWEFNPEPACMKHDCSSVKPWIVDRNEGMHMYIRSFMRFDS